MNGSQSPRPMVPSPGCLLLALVMFSLCLFQFFVDVMRTALERLHLSAEISMLAVIGIFAGSLFNIPIYRIEREVDQVLHFGGIFGLPGFLPMYRRVRRDTVIAVNVGGCLVPTALAVWEVLFLLQSNAWLLLPAGLVTAGNIYACYRVARPVEGMGIAMPGFVSPMVAVLLTWVLLLPLGIQPTAPVAFIAGVLGPLVGADLLHLRDITKVSVGMLSIGGAGTFDGIVLSGVLAALLA